MPSCGEHGDHVQVAYWMNRLQHHDERFPLVVSLNPTARPSGRIAEMTYTHPVYTVAARQAQRRLHELDSDRVVFAGSYHGWGFHEDGCAAGVAAATRLGARW
jgi:predicted NAD/FAD-binding protein